MDLDGFRSFILDSGIDVWTWIDMAISVASADHENELKKRRDEIIQKLYAPTLSKCQNCDHHLHQKKESEVYEQKQEDLGYDCEVQGCQSGGVEEEEEEDEQQRKILEIRVLLDDQNQSERSLIDLLQILVDMDTSFKALKETDIGRRVTKLRKHSSGEVRRLVKILVRKWKDTVDEWVRLNTPSEETTECIDDKKSPSNQTSCYSTSTPSKGKLRHDTAESDKQVASGAKHLLDQSPQEFRHAAKKQRSAVYMTDFHSNNGGSVPIKYW